MFTLSSVCGIHAELAHCLYSTKKLGIVKYRILCRQLKMDMKRPPHSTDHIHYC